MVQIVIEIITDTVCLVFEARRGLAPLAVWRELPKAALTPIVLFVLMFATLAGQMRSLYGDSVGKWQLARRVLVRGRRPPAWRRARGLLLAPVPKQLGNTDELNDTTQAGHLWFCSQTERRRPSGSTCRSESATSLCSSSAQLSASGLSP